MHRSSFQERVAQESLHEIKLCFSPTEFSKISWESKYKEFELNDKWYDVSRIEKTEDGFILHCVNDSLEESFVAMIDHWKKSNSAAGKTKIIFQPLFCSRLIQMEIPVILCDETSVSFSQKITLIVSLPIPSPPPEL